jgi:hypothetical protein
MPTEVYIKSHHAGATAAERIQNRLRPSNDPSGRPIESWPQRTVSTVHRGGSQHSQTKEMSDD